MIEFAFLTGWRCRSEVLPLEWRNVDFAAGEVRIDAGASKNGEPRVFPITARLRSLLDAQRIERERLKKEEGKIVARVFHRNGEPIRYFKTAWARACKAAGCAGSVDP